MNTDANPPELRRRNLPGILVEDFSPADARRERAQFWVDVAPKVADAVAATFVGDGAMRRPTMSEVRRRTTLAHEVVKHLRFELQWSRQRIEDNLETILRARLAGLAVDVQALGKRGSWFGS